MPSRAAILRRIRARRVTYGRDPADRVAQPTINKIDTTQEVKPFVPDWSARQDHQPEASRISPHRGVFGPAIKKFGQHDPGQLIGHLNNFFNKHKMNRDYYDHMKNAGYKIENPSHEWSAAMISRNAQLQTSDREVLHEMASFLEKTGKTKKFHEYLDAVRPESQDETTKT